MYFEDPIRQRLALHFEGGFIDISIGDGWLALVDELDRRLTHLCGDQGYALLQVKSKFGGLRYYSVFPKEVMHECQVLVEEAEKASFLICEGCGGPDPISVGWYALCAKCMKLREGGPEN